MTDESLREMFGYQEPTDAQKRSCVAIRTCFFNLARLVMANTPAGRAQSMALTSLQQACWSALAAVVDGNTPTLP